MSHAECPHHCQTCKSGYHGSGDQNGRSVNYYGLCTYFCDNEGYCGDGPEYRKGINCNQCGTGNNLIDM